eukprot:CAMPEP_0172202270 /NCGR_PEP_ID=MMETSP1050-20130122/30538_1 /TAXON_ID=233186 /ORGANISM="Cryptomonas curvata, Strain CCAP979/52" /LENGTH=78 /DNA_ID=CAMNT_0012880161 /DNA_START=234 /DNA_END=467 /DNA_ORIENTATION=+
MSKRSSLPGATDDEAPEPERIDQRLHNLDLLKRIESDHTMSSSTKKPRRYVSLLQQSALKPPSFLSCNIWDKATEADE